MTQMPETRENMVGTRLYRVPTVFRVFSLFSQSFFSDLYRRQQFSTLQGFIPQLSHVLHIPP